jgi:hypothetical protein
MKNFKINLLYGSLWGIVEATLGYVLHLVFIPFAGFIMFPIGVYFMKKAEKTTQKASSIVYVATIAAGIKLFNLFLPNINFFKVINPSISILLQGVAVVVLLSEYSRMTLPKTIGAGVFWRGALLIIMTLSSGGMQNVWYFQESLRWINFIVFESIVNGVLIGLLLNKVKISSSRLNPNVSFIAFFCALALQYIV